MTPLPDGFGVCWLVEGAGPAAEDEPEDFVHPETKADSIRIEIDAFRIPKLDFVSCDGL